MEVHDCTPSPGSTTHTITRDALVVVDHRCSHSELLTVSFGRGANMHIILENNGTWLASTTCVPLICHSTLPFPRQEKVAFAPRAAVVDSGGCDITWAIEHGMKFKNSMNKFPKVFC